MLPTAVLATSVRNSGARTADTSWCNTTIRRSRFVRPRNPLTFAVGKGRLSAPGVIRQPVIRKRITGRIASIGRGTRVDNGVGAMGECGFESRCVRFAVACAITRPHHPCEAVCKRKNLGVSPLRPSFIGSSVLCSTVQRRTMLHKTRYEYRYIYRGPMFSR